MIIVILAILVNVIENEPSYLSSILNDAACLSHRVNILEKGMDTTILPPVMGKIVK